jgi:hypothetical protein
VEKWDDSLPVLPNDVHHAVLQIGADQVMLADVHEADRGTGQRLSEGLPSLQTDIKILPHVQTPYAVILQNLSQQPQLAIQHTLQIKLNSNKRR